ncbi:hypothetical protein [Streptomyces sp. NPDC058653]|uniref:hypothetical protein n=1 Tax=Streptomyces sp. NPDC058653 TaxID=3346576 RepID=UPI0036672B35
MRTRIRMTSAAVLLALAALTGCGSNSPDDSTTTRPDPPADTLNVDQPVPGSAEKQIVWDTAWDGLGTDARTSICDLLQVQGVEAAADLDMEMAQYYLDYKC